MNLCILVVVTEFSSSGEGNSVTYPISDVKMHKLSPRVV